MDLFFALPSHAPELARIEALQPLAAGWGESGLRAELALPRALVCAAREGTRVTGFVCARWAADFAEVLNAAVDPAFTRRGAARAMLARLLQELRARGVRTVTLEVNENNLPARRLYEGAGFAARGRRKHFYGEEDALLMGAEL